MYSFEIYKRERKIQIGSKDFLLSHAIVRINMENTKGVWLSITKPS